MPSPDPHARPVWPGTPAVVGFLLVAAGLGVALRLALAGRLALPGTFTHLRHAHSHAGVYAVLFPLAFAAWKAVGMDTPGRRVRDLYFLAGGVAVVGFATAGYAALSISASTVVGAVWLFQAWLTRSAPRERQGALALLPVALVACTLMVPPIAVATARDPALGQALAHTFLALLFFLVMVPVALRRIGAGHVDARLFVPAAALAAVHLGAAPSLVGRLALLVLGAQLADAVLRSPAHRLYGLAWAGFGAGAVVLAAYTLAPHNLTVGGMHYLLLGPLFVSLALRPSPRTWGVVAAAAAMAAFLGPLARVGPEWTQLGAGAAGLAWAVLAVWGLMADRRA